MRAAGSRRGFMKLVNDMKRHTHPKFYLPKARDMFSCPTETASDGQGRQPRNL